MPRPIRASIAPAAFRHNLQLAHARAGRARVWTVVKADAYGHGLLRMAEAVADFAHGFALLDFAEAERLRAAGLRQPILLLEGCFDARDVRRAVELDLSVVVHRMEQIDWLKAAARPLAVYLKINTGMNRLGLPADALQPALHALAATGRAGPVTLMSHFADADGERGIGDAISRMRAATRGLDLPVSLANSAALLRFPESLADWVRPGIMLYGGSPFPQRASAAELGLRPVMTLESRIIGVQQLAAGERVGYGGLFEAPARMRVGVVACGYADGYPRHAPTGTPVLVAGRRTRTLGRVSMDMLVADLSDMPEAGIDTPVVLWGDGLPADDVATAAATVSYELFCALAPRVPVVTV